MRHDTARQYGIIHNMPKYLIVIGIICSWSAYVVVALNTDPTAFDNVTDPRSKPFIYYILHGAGIISLLTGGIFSMFNGEYGRVARSTRVAFWVLLISSITWAFVAYDVKDYLSWKALGSTGPLVWMSCVLIFAGMDRTVWKLLEPVIRFLSYITAILTLIAIIINYQYIAERWLSAPVQYMILLMWFGGWTLLTSWNCSGVQLYLRCFPYLVFILAAIITQTRSWCLMSVLLLIAIIYINNSTKTNRTMNQNKVIVNTSLIIVMLIITYFSFQGPIIEAFNRLNSRVFTDSRAGQYVEFFSQVSPTDLILGGGPNATWKFGTTEVYREYQYFDNAYLWMAFIGGLPLLGSYLILIVLPGIKLLFRGVAGNAAAAAILILLWGLACTGISTYTNPSLTPYSYLICLLSGRCLGILAEPRNNAELTGYI